MKSLSNPQLGSHILLSTAVGIKCKDGIVLGVEKLILSKMLESGAGRRIFSIDRHLGLVSNENYIKNSTTRSVLLD
jgi:20S proteasome alpha/beta subunit